MRTSVYLQANIFIDDEWHVRLADFGLTVISDVTGVIFTSTGRDSARWMAPELLYPASLEQSELQRTNASDVYAFGCSSWEVRNSNLQNICYVQLTFTSL
jgi:serine/threonine protein kinase